MKDALSLFSPAARQSWDQKLQNEIEPLISRPFFSRIQAYDRR
jgi:hypothetical protein